MQATQPLPNFASDNWAPAHPEVLDALVQANRYSVPSYGDDPYTADAIAHIKDHFGHTAQPYLVFTGTGANVLSLESCVRPYEAIVCTDSAHIQTSEWGAVERNTGSRLLPVSTQDGKLTVAGLTARIDAASSHPRSRAGAVSITQATEYGTVYTPDEVRAISKVAHEHGIYVHMDGARLANAAASLGVSLREASTDCGVDVLSFGATKNGALCAEAVVFMNDHLARDFTLRRKQGMQLASKLRFMSVQFTAMLTNDLWLRNAKHANAMATRLADGLSGITGVTVTQQVQANEVFAIVPRTAVTKLHEVAAFHMWDDSRSELRFVCSFDTLPEDVDSFIERAQGAVAS